MRFSGTLAIPIVGYFVYAALLGSCYADDIGETRAEKVGASLIGTKAPAVDVKLLDGTMVKLNSILGKKPIYLKFWATWCVPCRQQMPHLQSAYEKYGKDIEIVAVNVGINETLEAVRDFQKAMKLTMPIAIDSDGSIAKVFDLTVTPQHIVIDRSGIIRYVGHLASEELDQTLAAVAKEKVAPETEQAQPATGGPDADVDAIELLDGTVLHPEQADGKPVVLFFFATWCDWYLEETRPAMSRSCIEFQKRVGELYKQYGDQFQWVAIAQPLWTDPDDLMEYKDRLKVDYPLGLDKTGAWFRKFAIRDVPTVVVLDTKGDIHATVTDDAAQMDAVLASL